MHTAQGKTMYNNESDDIGEEEQSPLKKSYLVYVMGALFATPILSYLSPGFYLQFMFLGPICSVILLTQVFRDKERSGVKKLLFVVVPPLSILMSMLTGFFLFYWPAIIHLLGK